MGYTHYYTVHDLQQDLHVPEIAQDIRHIAMASEIPLANGLGEPGTQPVIEPHLVEINGVLPNRCGTFEYPPDHRWNQKWNLTLGGSHCKTRRRPYDVIVCAALMAVRHHLGQNVRVRSDGDFAHDPGWAAARDLYRRALRREPPELFHHSQRTNTPATAP